MGYTVPSTITTTQLITASLMNAEWVENIKFLANPPACRVYRTGASSVTNAVWESMPVFDAERYDTDSMHSTSVNSGRITINTAGLYVLGGNVEYAANPTGIRGLGLRVNNTTDIAKLFYANAGGVFGTAISICTVYKLTAGNYVELQAYQNSGGFLNVNAVSNISPEFYATWIGRG